MIIREENEGARVGGAVVVGSPNNDSLPPHYGAPVRIIAPRNQQIPSALHGNLPFLLIKLFRIQENPIFVPGTGLCQWRILPEAPSVIGGSPTGALQLNLNSD